jgi:folate-binding protein YgfZ
MNPRHCALPDLGCIAIRGDDARTFLHAQLARDIAALDQRSAPLAGWHDARGRVRALFRVLPLPDGWLLLTPRDAIDSAIGRLRMYVLRARVTLTSAPDWHVAALVGGDGAALAALGVTQSLPRDGVAVRDSLRFVRLGPEAVLAVGEAAALETLARQLPAGSQDLAWLSEIRLGLPAITAALAERFVAQMLNLDLLGAVSFDKGCYPGQEVIARVHNLGSVKRRMRRYALSSPSPPAPGTSVLGADGAAAGEVVRAAATGSGVELLAVVEHSRRHALTIGDPRRPLLELPLPYEVPAA